MTASSEWVRPSLLELARAGNFRAIAFWLGSLLAPYGITLRVTRSASGALLLRLGLPHWASRRRYRQLRQPLVRLICYRLWTLNAASIRNVRIVAQRRGSKSVIWQQSVRIVTPASRSRSRQRIAEPPIPRRLRWLWFQALRSAVVARLATTIFILSYWLLHWQASGVSDPLAQVSPVPVAIAPDAAPVPPQLATVEIGAAKPLHTLSQQTLERERQRNVTVPEAFQGQIVRRATTTNGEKLVALTFDDGPWPGSTDQVLAILKEHQIRATFFLVGQHVQTYPDIAKRVAAAGHIIGNHTQRHINHNMDAATAQRELAEAAQVLEATVGVRTKLLRPPAGNLGGQLVPTAQQQGYAIAMWSVDSDDYYVSSPILLDRVLRQVHPGAIVLLHDGGGDRAATVAALPQIITTLKQQGYQFVTLPELLERSAAPTSAQPRETPPRSPQHLELPPIGQGVRPRHPVA